MKRPFLMNALYVMIAITIFIHLGFRFSHYLSFTNAIDDLVYIGIDSILKVIVNFLTFAIVFAGAFEFPFNGKQKNEIAVSTLTEEEHPNLP